MNKYIKYGLICFAGGLLATSCQDVMDTKPFESYSEELVWSSKETADAFVINTYNSSVSLLAGSGMCASWEARTPNGVQCSQVGEGIDNYATELGIDVYTDMGFNRFGALRRCNLIIEKATGSTTLSDDKKKELIAEGHFLRGIIFFDQARKMGRFVPITKVLNATDTTDFKTPLTSSVTESYKYVMDDLTAATEGLPETSLSGRANKYAAHLIRSRAALQAYAYTKDASYLDKAIESANAVINSGRYTLTSNYGNMFNEKAPTDPEIILGRYYLAQNATVGDFTEMIRVFPNISNDDVTISKAPALKNPNGKTFEAWCTMFPTQDLVDQYLVIDSETGQAKPWYETSQYLKNVQNIDPSSLTVGAVDSYSRTNGEVRNIPTAQDFKTGRTDYALFAHYGKVKDGSNATISDIMYSNRDKRFYGTIVYDNSEWLGENVSLNLGGNISQGVRDKEDGGWYNTTTGYYWKKNIYTPSPRAFYSVKTDYHYVVARLGEAYMNLAEAYLLKKEISKAVDALNATRVKHGGLPISTAATEADAWKDYMRERRCEMAYECADIYFSYLRWGKYGGYSNYGESAGAVIKDLNRPVYKVEISRDRKSYCIGQLTLLNSWNRNFTSRRYLFPIPQGQIDTRSAHNIHDSQNEGW